MAMGKRGRERQDEIWVKTADLPASLGHPFYVRLSEVLRSEKFDDFAETACAKFYADTMGRPSIAPGVYFRGLLVGYLEGLDSERGIAWRCADSLSLREFLGYKITQSTPDHSTISHTRRRLPVEFHEEVFALVLRALAERGLVRGNTLGLDGSTMEANAALRSIVRVETGESYREFLEKLAKASGIETPTARDLARFDKNRKGKKTSNADWKNPHDPDAKIAKMKDGRTHMAYKPEHAVDLETGAIVRAEIHPADQGDTTTGPKTLERADEALARLEEEVEKFEPTRAEVVEDCGYHSAAHLAEVKAQGYRTCVSEPERPRRNWSGNDALSEEEKVDQQEALYDNRRRMKGDRGKRLARKRGEMVERSFAHMMDTGGMRRTWLRGRENVLKRYLIQAAAFNLGLVMRKILGFGKPRWACSRNFAAAACWCGVLTFTFARLRRFFREITFGVADLARAA